MPHTPHVTTESDEFIHIHTGNDICNQLALTYFSLLQTQVCLYVYLCHRTLKSIMLPILNSGHNVETHPTKDIKYLYLGGTLKYIMHYLWYYSCSDMFMINRQSEPRY